ncbi:MAG: hypothetical protein ACXWQO_09510 [Bdellovibrionota bacterium]
MNFRFLYLLLLLPSLACADGDFADRPEPGEVFSHFFQRITRGGPFQGMRLEAPEAFQYIFLTRILRPFWQGRLDKVQRHLTSQGVDLWLGWYATETPLTLLAANDISHNELSGAFDAAKSELGRCTSACRSLSLLEKQPWNSVSTEERHAFTWAYVTKAKIFGGRTLLEYLADEHGLKASDVLGRVDFRLLHAQEFAAAVRELGWNGEIYFRGITAPDPHDPHRFWILLNDDLMRKMTPFSRPLLQELEYQGILTHELSHVFQNIAAENLGFDLSIGSPEGALLVEGEAEWLAESAMDKAAAAQEFPSALALFSAEQGGEIVNRPGQATQGNLFPYTVGLPFAAALFDSKMSSSERAALREGILRVIAGKKSLPELLLAH